MRFLVLAAASLIVLTGCHGRSDPPSEAPTGVTATPGDGLAVVSWDLLPDLTYWIFYEAGGSVAVNTPQSVVIRNAAMPRVIPNLANGTQYAFVMNATHNDSTGGPTSLTATATPRPAGAIWLPGGPLPPGAPPQNLHGMASNGGRFVVVGDATTILWGDFNYPVGMFDNTASIPQAITQWMPPTLPFGFSSNLSSVAFLAGSFAAIGGDGQVISSPDGLTWTVNTQIPSSGGMNGIVFGNANGVGTYVAVGNSGQVFTTNNLTLPWTQVANFGLPNDVTSVSVLSFANGKFFVTGSGGLLRTSGDGVNWDVPFATSTSATLRDVVFNPAAQGVQLVAVGDGGTIVTSSDGQIWTSITLPGAPDLRSITFGGVTLGRFLAVGKGAAPEEGVAVYCDSGCDMAANWTQVPAGALNLTKVQFAPTMYLAVGDAGANTAAR